MRKANFVVSNANHWFDSRLPFFLINPYLEKKYRQLGTCRTAPPLRPDLPSLAKAQRETLARNERYTTILHDFLNQTHGTNYPRKFWEKFFCLFLYRLTSALYDRYHLFLANFSLDEHEFRLIEDGNAFVPRDAYEARQLLTTGDFMQEQLFSGFVRLFHPGRKAETHPFTQLADEKLAPFEVKSIPLPKEGSWLGNLLKSAPAEVLAKMLRRLPPRSPRGLIVDAYFSQEIQSELFLRSGRTIYPVELPRIKLASAVDEAGRAKLGALVSMAEDDFDRYFFTMLPQLLPRSYLEDFRSLLSYYENLKYPEARFIVSEAWINDDRLSLFLALQQERGVQHIYYQHGMGQVRECGMSAFLAERCNIFLSFGWTDPAIPKLVPGGYARRLRRVKKPRATGKILNLAFSGEPYTIEISDIEQFFGHNILHYLDGKRAFFSALKPETIRNVIYKPYPNPIPERGWDVEGSLQEFISQAIPYPAGADMQRMIQESALTVVDYIGTAYNEPLLLNCPVMVLDNKNYSFIRPEYREDFEEMRRAGIYHTDPVAAAAFLESIKENPREWWDSRPVQEARTRFLAKNFGPPSKVKNLLLGLCRQKRPIPSRSRKG